MGTTLATSTICYTTGATLTAACTGRKKRTILESPMDTIDYEVNPVSREARDIHIQSSDEKAVTGGSREGKFLMYWMTTTSTTTATSFSSTVTLSAVECTPSNFIFSACGKK